jgi:uncharacterized membrane protein
MIRRKRLNRLPSGPRNPSRWSKRVTLAFSAAAGLAIAMYLSLYQFGLISSVWDPLFGAESERVLHSPLSRLLPVPDAALGALGYAFEVILVLAGSSYRWRTQRWIVRLYGFVVLSLAFVGIALVIYQSASLHAWCTLCLGSGVLSIAIAAAALDEVAATWRR